MLASLSSRLLDVRVEYKRAEEDQTIIVDVDALRELSVPDVLRELAVPDVATRLAGLCGRIYSALGDDVQTLSQALLALENDEEEACEGGSSCAKTTRPLRDVRMSHEQRSRRRRRVSTRFCHLQEPLILPSPCPGVPTIIITPAPPSPPVTTRTPWQDAAFGDRLTVPGHPAFNAAHPPQAPVHGCTMPRPDAWEWREGRWVALLPGLDAQAARGVYSRPLVVRRKASRRR